MSDSDGYNGWSNRATWAANLHLSNDEGLWNQTLEHGRQAVKDATDRHTAGYELSRSLKAWVQDELLEPDYWADFYTVATDWVTMPQWAFSMLRDIGDPDAIDWYELAESVLESVEDGAE